MIEQGRDRSPGPRRVGQGGRFIMSCCITPGQRDRRPLEDQGTTGHRNRRCECLPMAGKQIGAILDTTCTPTPRGCPAGTRREPGGAKRHTRDRAGGGRGAARTRGLGAVFTCGLLPLRPCSLGFPSHTLDLTVFGLRSASSLSALFAGCLPAFGR